MPIESTAYPQNPNYYTKSPTLNTKTPASGGMLPYLDAISTAGMVQLAQSRQVPGGNRQLEPILLDGITAASIREIL